MKGFKFRALCAMVFAISQFPVKALAFDPPMSFTYQGKVYQANGTDPVEDSNVTFKIQIYSPDGTCLLYEETHPRDMTGSSGLFSLNVGEGANSGATTLTLMQVFDNSQAIAGAASCSYSPASGDTRRFRVSFNDNGTNVTLPVDQTIRSVPYALDSMSLEGMGKNQFLQVSANSSQVKLDALMANYVNLLAISNGTSTVYAKSTDLPISGGVLNLSSGGVQVPDVPLANNDAVNKNYSDANLGGRGFDLTGLTNGETVVWNSTLNKWQVAEPNQGTVTSITAGTGLAGGTITGSGTISLSNVGTAGTYQKVTTDLQGRVVSGSNLSSADIVTALGYTPLNQGGGSFGRILI